MNNEPKASMNLDPELLAAYIDQRLSPEQRAAVEAELAKDPDAYAVLVESIKALDQMKVPELAKVPKVRRWTIAAGVLAAAAALVLVVQLQPGLFQRFRGNGLDSRIVALYEAEGPERNLDARLTGDRHRPLRPVTRGPLDGSRNFSLVAEAGRIQSSVQQNESASNLRAWGVAQLLTGRLEDATAAFRSALDGGLKDDATVHSDAAAAHLALANSGKAESLPLALEHASQATSLDPNLPAASFNRALALEALALSSDAISEWRRYLTIESDAEWRQEAAVRLAELEQRVGAKQSLALPSTVDQLASLTTPQIVALAAGQTAAVRAALEGPLLLDALTTGAIEQATPGFIAATRLANEIHAQTGDTLTAAIWSHAAASQRRGEIRDGVTAHVAGLALVRALNFSEAEREFKQGALLLDRAGSPLGAWSDFYLAHTAYYLGRTAEALALVRSIAESSVAQTRLALAGRAFYLTGLCHLRFRQHASVVTSERRAIDFSSRARESVIEVSARSEVADALDRLARSDDSWRERAAVLRRADEIGQPLLSHLALSGAARSAATEGRLLTAQAFSAAMLENANRWKHPGAMAEARLRLADVAYRRGDNSQALLLLDEADQIVSELPDSPSTDGLRLDFEIVRAAANVERSPSDAYAASTRAFAILEKRQSSFQLARAKWLRGMSLAKSRPELARAEFLDGLRASDVSPTGVDPFGRSQAEQRWELLKALMTVGEHHGESESDLAEVISVLTGRLNADTLAELRAALRPTDALLVLVALDDQLVRWLVTSTAINKTTHPVSRRTISALIEQHTGSFETPRRQASEPAAAALAEALLRPVVATQPSRLLLITDSLIARVAFAAMSLPGSARPLAASTDIVVIGWQDSHHRSTAKRGHSKGVLIIGAPDTTALQLDLPPLPGATAEAVAVARMYQGASTFVGVDATKKSFLELAPSAQLIHYAGHALGNRIDPGLSRLLFAGESGELTAGEIVQIPLRAQVVVLGACEGSVPSAAAGEAVFGLARAFLQAGASTVIAARWQIADKSATELLMEVHRQLSAGVAPETALRLAQNQLRQDDRYSHPYFWAGFGVYASHVPSPGETR